MINERSIAADLVVLLYNYDHEQSATGYVSWLNEDGTVGIRAQDLLNPSLEYQFTITVTETGENKS